LLTYVGLCKLRPRVFVIISCFLILSILACVWCVYLKTSQKTVEKFRKFKTMVENQSGCNIEVLCTDRGSNCVTKEFNFVRRRKWHSYGVNNSLHSGEKWSLTSLTLREDHKAKSWICSYTPISLL